MSETIQQIGSLIENGKKIHHVVVNAAKLVKMQKDERLREAIVEYDIINSDGQSIVWASQFLGTPLKERVAGIDLMENLVKLAHKRKYRVFLLGATAEVVKRVAETYSTEFDDQLIAGYRDGYFSAAEEVEVADQIAMSRPDMLFVAISSPKKELFLDKFKDVFDIPFVMGVGGSFDIVSGLTKRAPKWMQKNGLEWFYRVLQEPRRMWKRYLTTNALFVFLVIKERFRK